MHVSSRRRALAIALFSIVFILIVTLSLASTTWAAPGAQGTVPPAPAPTGSSGGGGGGGGGGGEGSGAAGGAASTGGGAVCAIGDTGAQCSATDVIVVVGASTVGAGSALTIEGPFGQPPCPDSPAGHTFLQRCYRFSWIGTNAQALTAISGPVQYCITFGPQQLTAVGNKPENLLIGLASAGGTWTLVKPTLDAAGGRVCATSDQLIQWAGLFAPQSVSPLLPTTGAGAIPFWLLPLAVVGAFMVLSALRLSRQQR